MTIIYLRLRHVSNVRHARGFAMVVAPSRPRSLFLQEWRETAEKSELGASDTHS